MSRKPFLYIALDADSQKDNIELAYKIRNSASSFKHRYGFKVNLDSVANFAPDALNAYNFITEVSGRERPIFVDMKMWNGGRTMENIAKGCVDLGVDIINMYPHAGGKFMRKVANTLQGTQIKLFGLTVLTHYTDDDTQKIYKRSLSETVEFLASICHENGAQGIVVPGTQLAVVQNLSLLKLCPAIRPNWYADTKANAQEQTVTPLEAIRGGASYIVAGSPIAKSPDPIEALEKILAEIA